MSHLSVGLCMSHRVARPRKCYQSLLEPLAKSSCPDNRQPTAPSCTHVPTIECPIDSVHFAAQFTPHLFAVVAQRGQLPLAMTDSVPRSCPNGAQFEP